MLLPHVLAEAKAPRYTSYPTAPHFSAAISHDIYAHWLLALPRAAELSLYIHVPFCRELCLYCGCYTKAVQRPEPVRLYAQWLLREIALVADFAGRRRVTRIHWGGGTPSILGRDLLMAVYAEIAAAFDLSDVREHAIELDPRAVDRPTVEALRQIGIGRASLGVQDISPHVQRAIGRIQPPEQVKEAIGLLRAAGIDQINFDLMYGLPKQTLQDIWRNIEFTARLRPQRLALFGYAHVPWLRPHQRLIDADSLPGAAERLDQAEAARTMLMALGYQPVGLDHFALPDDELARAARVGTLRRNFQGYTTDDCDALIGLGASAIGRLPQGYAQNAHDFHAYSRALVAGLFATEKGAALTPDDRVRAEAIERLMCDLAADLDRIDCTRAPALRDEFERRLASLIGPGAADLVELAGNRIEITERGRPFVRLIASALDSYLEESPARHSVAV